MNYIRFIAALVVIVSTLIGCGDQPSNWPKKSFDATKWTASNEKDRFVFVRDLVESKLLLASSRHEIFQLLGKPSYEASDGSYLTYIVKAETGSVSLLDIRFESKKPEARVKNVLVRSD